MYPIAFGQTALRKSDLLFHPVANLNGDRPGLGSAQFRALRQCVELGLPIEAVGGRDAPLDEEKLINEIEHDIALIRVRRMGFDEFATYMRPAMCANTKSGSALDRVL